MSEPRKGAGRRPLQGAQLSKRPLHEHAAWILRQLGYQLLNSEDLVVTDKVLIVNWLNRLQYCNKCGLKTGTPPQDHNKAPHHVLCSKCAADIEP